MANQHNHPEHFRFFDNREKYLLFVTTTSEKWVVAERVGMELDQIQPTPPDFRLFDAGMGDGTVLMRVMQNLHRRFPTVPFLIVAKETSLEDARLGLNKLAERFVEHPLTVVVLTNMYYSEAPWLRPRKPEAQAAINWLDVPLQGNTAYDFDNQIKGLQTELADGWQTRTSPKTGNPLYVRPSAVVLYREDHKFILDATIPKPGPLAGDYDLIIAAQPYRARQTADKKVKFVLAPLASALAPGGRMVVVQSTGHDPGMEIIRKIWPDEDPFWTPRHVLIKALRDSLGQSHPELTFDIFSDEHSLFTYQLHSLPDETSQIGTSNLLAAWNAAVYVAQMDDERLNPVLNSGAYLEATREVLQRNGGLWFLDESFVITRERPHKS
ncbi:hypothetical protein [Candidatus Leptofilum sp.]|uniref:hypothetical protein n=1 Tax=Candidatus Leptofilum sp. TaxID=3241576 RepID=UPI003B5A9FB4